MTLHQEVGLRPRFPFGKESYAQIGRLWHEFGCGENELGPGGKMKLTCCAKGVARGEFPHAGEQLGESADAEGHAYDHLWVRDVADGAVVQRQDERRGCK